MQEKIRRILASEMIGFDIETRDPDLPRLGSSIYRGGGYVCGVAVASEHEAVYLDLAHFDTSSETAARNMELIREVLNSRTPKVGANILYDVEWLNSIGVDVCGELNDVQLAEPLIDEYARSYSLSALSEKYTLEAKATQLLTDYCSEQGWTITKEKSAASYIWQMPSCNVRRYAELDGMLPVQILKKQRVLLEKQGLTQVYRMECDLIPLLLRMRKQGVRIDIPTYKKTSLAVADKHYELRNAIFEWAGGEINIGSTTQLAKLFDAKGLPYPRKEPTALMRMQGKRGNPNIDKEVLLLLSAQGHEIARKVLNYRHYDTLINMFLIPYSDFLVNGRLHCNFHPLRSDEYGAVSGRFSSSRPNLQQVSANDDDEFSEGVELLQGKILRRMFIPEEGCLWGKLDYSQVEYRIAAHYAVGPKSDELRWEYNNDPSTDYHKRIEDLTGFDRRQCKRLNFGASYGMGIDTAARKFGWTREEAEMFMEGYHKAAPYLKVTRRKVVERADSRGFIFTLLGRRARTHHSRKLHSLYNRLIQGTAADIMKAGMVKAWESGVFDTLHPHLTVHDELDVSVPDSKVGREALEELKCCMETCVKLKVPLVVDAHLGKNWEDAD